jgi:small subunit ribosomal protein S3
LGQKVNPIGLRLGIVKTWESRWYADKKYSDYILEDYNIRKFVKKKLYHAGISKIEIERSSKRVRLRIFTARPGLSSEKKVPRLSGSRKSLKR